MNYYDEIFYPNCFNDSQKLKLITSDFWTPALSIHLALDKLPRITKFDPDKKRVYFATHNGFPAFVFGHDSNKGHYFVSEALGTMDPHPVYKPVIKSTSPRYFATALRKAHSEHKKDLLAYMEYRSKTPAKFMTDLYNKYYSRFNRPEQFPVTLSGLMQGLLVRYFFGQVKHSDVDQHTQDLLTGALHTYDNAATKVQDNITFTEDLFKGPRWLVIYNDYGVLVGLFDTTSLAQRYLGQSDNHVEVTALQDMQYFPTLDDIPQPLQNDLCARLTLWKMYRERNYAPGYTIEAYDPRGLLPKSAPNDGEYTGPSGSVFKFNDNANVILLTQ